MKEHRMKDKILQALSDGPLTFPELAERVGDPGGTNVIESIEVSNVFLWGGMSRAFAVAVIALKEEGSIGYEPDPESPIEVTYGGKPMLVFTGEEGGLEEPHYLPVKVRRRLPAWLPRNAGRG